MDGNALNTIYNSHLEGEERELAVAEAVAENAYNKIIMAYEMCCMQEKQMLADAELKVFKESGTYDDLAYLVEGAEAEVGENKKGILQKLIDAIISLCSSIRNSIKSLFGKGNPDDEIEISAEDEKKHNAIVGAKGKIQKVASLVKSGNYGEAAKEALPIAGIIVGTAAAAGGTAAAVHMVKKKRSEVEAMTKDSDDTIGVLQGAMDAVKSKLGSIAEMDIVKGALDKIKSIIDAIKKHIDSLKSKMGGVVDSAKAAVADVKDNKDANKGNDTQTVKVKGMTFNVDINGNIKAFNKKNEEVPVDMKVLPAKVKELVDQIKNGTKESFTTDEIQEMLGEAFVVEFVDDSTIEIKASDYVIESEEIDTESSIFGTDIEASAEDITESALDKELESLAELFANI